MEQTIIVTQRRGSSLGVAACILGVLGLLISWIPAIGLIGVPLSGLGLLLGLTGLLVAIFRRGSGIGLPIAGCAISALALILAIGTTTIAGKAVQEISQEHRRIEAQPSR